MSEYTYNPGITEGAICIATHISGTKITVEEAVAILDWFHESTPASGEGRENAVNHLRVVDYELSVWHHPLDTLSFPGRYLYMERMKYFPIPDLEDFTTKLWDVATQLVITNP